eukprot:g75998.t1
MCALLVQLLPNAGCACAGQAEAKKAEEEAKKVGGATDVLQWDVAAVIKWLAGLDLGQDVVESFQKNKINGCLPLPCPSQKSVHVLQCILVALCTTTCPVVSLAHICNTG